MPRLRWKTGRFESERWKHNIVLLQESQVDEGLIGVMSEFDYYTQAVIPSEDHPGHGFFVGGALIAIFSRDIPYHEELIANYLDHHHWVAVPNTRQQLVLSYGDALQYLTKTEWRDFFQKHQGWIGAMGYEEGEGPATPGRLL